MRHHIHTALLAALVAGGITFFVPRPAGMVRGPEIVPANETAYQRIMRTGVMRCGYNLWEPLLARDAKTGEMSGLWVKVTEALAASLAVQVQWTQENNMATYLADMQSGKVDVDCGGGWPNAERGKQAEYTIPAFYNAVYPIVRFDDERFDNHYDRIDAPAIRVALMPGSLGALLRDRLFPQSTAYALEPQAPVADMALSVIANKADVAFLSAGELQGYMRLNPGRLRAAKGLPLKVIPQSYAVAAGEYELKAMLDTALHEMLNDGAINALLDAHEQVPDTYLRVAHPYALPAPAPTAAPAPAPDTTSSP